MSDTYKVVVDPNHVGCIHCGHDAMWTISEADKDDGVLIGSSWGDRELVEDICDLMNMAYEAGREFEAS